MHDPILSLQVWLICPNEGLANHPVGSLATEVEKHDAKVLGRSSCSESTTQRSC